MIITPWTRTPRDTADQREYADTRRRFAHIAAWGASLGSLSGYIRQEIEQAARDNAPDDVVYSRDWDALTDGQQRGLLLDETDGHAYIVRDDQGAPVRVWSRIVGFDNRIVKRDIETIAARIREHGAPWSPTDAERAELVSA